MHWERSVNAYERFRSHLVGTPVDRAPNFDIFMAFAAHLIGEPLRAYYTDHHVLCEANLAVAERFDIDIVQAISDPYREAHDFGAEISFPTDDLPVCSAPLLKTEKDLLTLPTPDPATGPRMSDRLTAVSSLRASVGGEIPIMGWVEGALAEAADLRGVQSLLMDLVIRPSWVRDLLEHCVDVAITFAEAQMDAGADIIGLGDAIASQISPQMYRTFALPYEQRIIAAIQARGGVARLHICGDVSHLLAELALTGADIIDLDWMVSIPSALEHLREGPCICGNIDPVAVVLNGDPQTVCAATLETLADGRNRLFVAAGCEIPDGTPHENLDAQSAAIRAHAGGIDARTAMEERM